LIVDKKRVLDALATLKAELAGDQDIDPQARETLERMAADVQARMESGAAPTGEDEESLSGQLDDVLLGFEAEHPKVTAAINQVAAALASLGI
jgi:hypothetical protein